MATPQHPTVDAYLASLDARTRARVNLARAAIMAAHPQLVEVIKWNSPSYQVNGDDRVTINARGERVLLVLHRGAVEAEKRGSAAAFADPEGLVSWVSDIRGTITIGDIEQIHQKSAAITELLSRWVAL